MLHSPDSVQFNTVSNIMGRTITTGRTIDILLVEDNPGDIRLAQEALKDYRMQNTMQIVRDGDDALKYLRREAPFESATKPDMILLDINLPRMDGTEVLSEMSQDPELRQIPVVILTTSKIHEDFLRRYRLPAECFITKPLTVERYLDAVRCFPHLGVSIVTVAGA
jgi:two-component system, chemotaxis family, response regulator Rcp1